MGLIKALSGAVGGTLADQWKEFFYCDALSSDTLMIKGEKLHINKTSVLEKMAISIIIAPDTLFEEIYCIDSPIAEKLHSTNSPPSLRPP